jgi:hypothetical protein
MTRRNTGMIESMGEINGGGGILIPALGECSVNSPNDAL